MAIYKFSTGGSRKYSEQWGFSDDVLPEASVFDMTVRSGGSVVSSPVEEGSFTSYNKTTEPLEVGATLSFSGTDSYLQSALDSLETLKENVTTFSIRTPLHEYENMTLQSYDYVLRREDGRGVLYVNADFVEIREVGVAYSETENVIAAEDAKNASDVSSTDGGLRQTQSAGSSESSTGASAKKSLLYTIGEGW